MRTSLAIRFCFAIPKNCCLPSYYPLTIPHTSLCQPHCSMMLCTNVCIAIYQSLRPRPRGEATFFSSTRPTSRSATMSPCAWMPLLFNRIGPTYSGALSQMPFIVSHLPCTIWLSCSLRHTLRLSTELPQLLL